MDLGEKLGENGIFGQVGPVTAQKVWCHGRLLNTNLFYTTNRLDWDKRQSYWVLLIPLLTKEGLGEVFWENGFFSP